MINCSSRLQVKRLHQYIVLQVPSKLSSKRAGGPLDSPPSRDHLCALLPSSLRLLARCEDEPRSPPSPPHLIHDSPQHSLAATPPRMFKRDVNTFKLKKNSVPGSRRFEMHQHAQATLGAGRLEEAVKLPPGEDLYDWQAVNVTDFYNEVNLLYGVLVDVCTPNACPISMCKSSQTPSPAC